MKQIVKHDIGRVVPFVDLRSRTSGVLTKGVLPRCPIGFTTEFPAFG